MGLMVKGLSENSTRQVANKDLSDLTFVLYVNLRIFLRHLINVITVILGKCDNEI